MAEAIDLQDPTLPLMDRPGSSLLLGVIDFDRLGAVRQLDVTETDDRIALKAPGLALDLRRSEASWSFEGSRLLVAVGRPLLDGTPADAQTLLAGTSGAAIDAHRIGGRFALVWIDLLSAAVRLLTDRFAVWPLCWSRQGTRLVFSDRADDVAIVVQAEIDPQSIHDYVYFHMIPAPRTIYRGVHRLEAATELSVTAGRAGQTNTWQPCFSRTRRGDEKDLAVAFRGAITSAVQREADKPGIGCFLSGGTDSSTVAGTLKAVTGKAATFSIGFDAAGYDEMEYARIAARHFGTDHHEHYITPDELVERIPAVATSYDQPFGNSSAVPAYLCAQLARSAGVTRMLAGDGGDELFGGNSRYAKQKIFEAWWRVPGHLRPALRLLIANPLSRALPIARKAASYIDQASVPMPARMETYNLLHRFGAESVFSPQFLASVDRSAPDRLQAAVYSRQAEAALVDRMLAYDWRFTLSDNDLPKVTGTTRLAGVGVGFPLLDDALVDLSLKLAPGDKVHGLKLRHFFKSALVGFLPDEIITKKKHGFGLPVGVWLTRHPRFQELARHALERLAARDIVRRELVDDLFSRRLSEHAGYYGEMVWVLMMLELWLASRDRGSIQRAVA